VNPAILVVLAMFVAIYGWIALFARRHPLLGRLATREAVRRRGQTVLVVAGLMVGSATITAALVGADSVGDSVVDSFAYRNLGYVDLTVNANNRPFPEAVADRIAASDAIASVTDGVAGGIEYIGSAADLDTRLGSSRVTLVGFAPSRQEPFGAYQLTDGTETFGDDLEPGEVLLSRTLASKLQSEVGDALVFSLESNAREGGTQLRVAGIARQEGPGAYTLGAAVFAPLETARAIVGSTTINVVRISAPGEIRDSLDAASRAAPVIRDAVASIEAPVPLVVAEVKQDAADGARQFTAFLRAMLIGMSSLVVAAGAALVVNLIGMLTEERRRELGTLRALGLRRRRLVGLSVIEGAMYSVAAGAIGIAIGIPTGRLISSRFASAFAEFAGEAFDFEFFFTLKGATLVLAFAIGSMLTLGVVFLASRRTARMSIVAAIRDLPEPPAERHRKRKLRTAAWVLAGGLGGLGVLSGESFPRLAGSIALILVLARVLRARLSPRLHATLMGLALAGAAFASIASESPDEDAGSFFLTFTVAMLTSVLGATLAAAANLRVLERLASLPGRASARARAAVRPPLAYLARRPVRTGLTAGVFAIVIGMLTLFSVFAVIFRADYDRFGGGYDVRVLSTGTSRIELPTQVEPEVERSIDIPTLGYVGEVETEGAFSSSGRQFVPLFEITDRFAAEPPVTLEQRDDAYATETAVWEAVERDPSLVVSNFGAVGQTISLEGRDGFVTFTIIGLHPFGLVDGLFATARALEPFADAPRGVTVLVDITDQARAGEVAREIESSLFELGVDAESVQSLLDTIDRGNRAFFSTIDVLMRMGLVVGILSLGIVALRMVVERRHVIGVLRALGYKQRAVMAGLMAEATATAMIGAIVGMGVGFTMGYLFYRQQDSQPGFGIDWANILGVLGLMFAAVLIVTVIPAWRASRLPPAEAVRYIE